MGRKYVIYQRVSTDEQAERGYSLEAMLEKCKHYIQSQEDAKLVKIFEDRGFSGTTDPVKRPALNQLLSEVKDKIVDFDTVLVWKLDRLSRSIRDTLNCEYLLRKHNVALESVTERIDTSTASGKMFFNTIASFAEFESAQIGERTWNTMSSKVGQIHLGGKATIGYKLIGNKLMIDRKTSEIVETIFRRFIKVKNYSKVAEYLNKKGMHTSCGKPFSHKKVKRIIVNPVYTGATVWNKRQDKLGRSNPDVKWIKSPNTHSPIITEKLFRRAQELIIAGHGAAHVSNERVVPSTLRAQRS